MGKDSASTVASCGVAAPTGDSTCKTESLINTDPTVALSHGDGAKLLGTACTTKDSDTDTCGCDASTAEDTSDLGSMSKHSTKNSESCKFVLSEAVVPSRKDAEDCALVTMFKHAGIYRFDVPAAGHGSDHVECHCNSLHSGTPKLEAHLQDV